MNNHQRDYYYSPATRPAYSQTTTPDRLRIVGSDLPASSSQTHSHTNSPTLAMQHLLLNPTSTGLAQIPPASFYSDPRAQSMGDYFPGEATVGPRDWEDDDNNNDDAKPSATDPEFAPAPKSGRPKGRPKGWRAGMTYREARGQSPARPKPTKPKPLGRPRIAGSGAGAGPGPGPATDGGGALPKRRGRPPRSQLKMATLRRKVYDEQRPIFLEFICEWQGCKARLHNADTLDRHVEIVHGKRQDDDKGRRRVCMWGRCALQHGDGEDGDIPQPKTPSDPPERFPTLALFNEHMHGRHLRRVRRIMGDGPYVNIDKGYAPADISRYLHDRRGRPVAPLLGKLEDAIEDEATRKMRKAALKRILQQRDDNAPVEDEEEDDGDEAEEDDGDEAEEDDGDEAEELAASLGGGMGLDV